MLLFIKVSKQFKSHISNLLGTAATSKPSQQMTNYPLLPLDSNGTADDILKNIFFYKENIKFQTL